MVGIDAILLVFPCNAVLDDIAGGLDGLGDGAHAVAAAFDTCTVAARNHVGIIAVLPCPATVYHNSGIVGNQVVTVVAVTPGATSANHVIGMGLTVQMESETVAVAASSVFRHGVVVVVGIAVEHQIVASTGEIDADAHSVVDVHLLDDTVAASAHRDILALRMAGDGDLNTDNVELSESPVVALHIESADALPCRLHQREVDYGLFVFVARDGDRVLRCAAGRQVIHTGIEITLLIAHDFSPSRLVGAFAQIDRRPCLCLADGLLQRGKRCIDGARVRITALG